jgi:hypothetical protein
MATQEEPRSEQQVIARFQELRQALNVVWSKITDLESEAAEHDLVLKTLEPMAPSRKCFRRVRRRRRRRCCCCAPRQPPLPPAPAPRAARAGRARCRRPAGGCVAEADAPALCAARVCSEGEC